MNKKFAISSQTLAVILLSLVSLCLAGCASTGYKKSDAAGRSLQDACVQVQVENQAIDATMSALSDLVDKPSGDLKPQFKRYCKALDRLVVSAKRTENAGAKTAQKHAAYFATWDSQLATMDYEAIRGRSEARKSEVMNHFATLNQRYNQTQTVVQPLISYLEDIRMALAADLTIEGLAAVKNIVGNANQNAVKVRAALGGLVTELAASSVRISSIAPQNAQLTSP